MSQRALEILIVMHDVLKKSPNDSLLSYFDLKISRQQYAKEDQG